VGTCLKIVVDPGTTVAPVLVLPAIAARRASPINGAAENDNHICMTIIIITFNFFFSHRLFTRQHHRTPVCVL
jgi:hypothetical protein